MTANVYFDHNGEFIPALVREIKFTTVNGAKRALINCIRKMQNSLYMQYGGGQKITVIASIPQHTKPDEYFLKTEYTTNFGLV